jgi:pimeloyl-ACP methyl ester carboxylesterase
MPIGQLLLSPHASWRFPPLSGNRSHGRRRFDRVQHGYAVSEAGVKIHYATLGKGPLVVMIHGFPDFWYSWRHQMAALSDTFQVVAIDQRGYNLSDKPKGVENYGCVCWQRTSPPSSSSRATGDDRRSRWAAWSLTV